MNKRVRTCISLLAALLTASSTVAVTPEYGVNTYLHEVGYGRIMVSVPTLHGVEPTALRGIVVRIPGDNGSTAAPADPRLHKWMYENKLAFWGSRAMAKPFTTTILAQFAADYFPGRPEFPNLPIMVYGGSSGGDHAFIAAYDYSSQVIAAAPEHSRNFLRSRGPYVDPPYPARILDVPMYFRWGEWDWERFTDGYGYKLLPTMAQGPHHWMFVYESRLVHALETYATEETIPFFHWIMEHRYDYQQGVAGKDPALGPVNLIALTTTNGWAGEHNLGQIQTVLGGNPSALPNFALDWETADPHTAPYNQFERKEADKRFHSWMPDARVAAFWATKFSHGNFDLQVEFPDMIDEDLIRDAVIERASIFPNYFNNAQSARMIVEPIDFPGTVRVDFFANEQVVASLDSPPYAHAYDFGDLGPGMYSLYAAAVTATGERSLSRRRVVQVYANTRGANTAPTITPIDPITVYAGTSVSVPFSIGDAETPAGDLTVSFTELNRSKSVANGSYTVAFTGTGANRSLNITAPPTPGVVWGIVHVSDGDISANAYVTINITGDGSSAPFFVQAVVSPGYIFPANAWSRRISVPVYDFDTDVRDLVLTATPDPTNMTQNVRIGGAGQYRYVQVKAAGGLSKVYLTLSDGISEAGAFFNVPARTRDNQAPIISVIPDQVVQAGHVSAPIEVRLHDLHHAGAQFIPADGVLTLTVTSLDETIIPNANIVITPVGKHRRITLQPLAGQTGMVTLNATVTDPEGLTAVHLFDVEVVAPGAPDAPDTTLASAVIGQAYSATLPISGGAVPLTWSLASGTVPPGLNVNANGTITGTPTTPGLYTFTVEVIDNNSATDTAMIDLRVRTDLTAPADFDAVAQVDGSVQLTWTDTATGESGFEIQRRAAYNYQWLPVITTASNAESFNDDDSLIPANFYEYRLRAVSAGEQGAWTRVILAETIGQPTISGHPQDLTFVERGNPRLNVQATGGQLNYQWYLGASGDMSEPVPGANAPSVQFFNVTEPATYWVRVWNGVGSTNSLDATLTPVDAEWPILIDFGMDPTDSPDDQGRHWNSMTEWNINTVLPNLVDSGGNETIYSATIGTWNFYYDSQGLLDDTLYPVTAQKDSFYTVYPNNGDIVIGGLMPHTAYILEVFASRSSHDTNAAPYISHYAAEGVSDTLIAANNTNQTVALEGVTSKADGTILLRVTTSDGQQNNRGHIGVLAITLTGPGIITQPAGYDVPQGDTATLSVSASAYRGDLTYQWYQGESGDTSQPIAGATNSVYTTPALDTLGEFPFWVEVSDEVGTTPSHTAVIEVVFALPPAPITDLSTASVGNTMLTLNWTATGAHGTNGTATSYDIRYSRTPITDEASFFAATQVTNPPVPGASGSPQSLTIERLWPGHGYYVVVRVINSAGTYEFSNPIAVVTDPNAEIYHMWLDVNAVNAMGTNWSVVVQTNRVTFGTVASYADSHTVSTVRNWNENGARLYGASGNPLAILQVGSTAASVHTAGGSQRVIAYDWYEVDGEVRPETPLQRCFMHTTGDLPEIFHGGRLNIYRMSQLIFPKYVMTIPPYVDQGHLDVVFTDLPPGTYDLTFGLQGGHRCVTHNTSPTTRSQYLMFSNAWTKISLMGVAGFTQASSPSVVYPEGVHVPTVLLRPENDHGEVARWTGIQPVNGHITVRFSHRDDWMDYINPDTWPPQSFDDLPEEVHFYMPQLMRLRYEGPGLKPDLTAQPEDAGLLEYQQATLSVTAEPGFGELAYQWYAGISGDTNAPIHGATGPSLTTAPLPVGDYPYWVAVSDLADTVASRTAWVVVNSGADIDPPSTVTNLTIPVRSRTMAQLVWTAPHDAGSGVASYEIRYSEAPITPANFNDAILVPAPLEPAAPGDIERIKATGLRAGTTYYFALRSTDAFGNFSDLSNIAEVQTPPAVGILIDDFNTGGGVNFPNTWNHGSHTTGWQGRPSTAASGYAKHIAEGGVEGGFARLHRYWSGNGHVLSIWANRQALGIEAGKRYHLAFDYKTDQQGTAVTVGSRAFIGYAVGQRVENSYVEAQEMSSYYDHTFSNTNAANWVLRQRDGPFLGGFRTRPSWSTYVCPWPFEFSEASDLVFVALISRSFGMGNGGSGNWDSETDYTWIGIDNVRLVPYEDPWTGYDGWVKTYGLAGDHALRPAAPFLDATPNLLKYALGMRGDDLADEDAQPHAWLNQPNGTLDYLFRRMQPDLTYTLEGTESLVPPNWQPHATNPGEVGEEVTVPINPVEHHRLFLRLKVQD